MSSGRARTRRVKDLPAEPRDGSGFGRLRSGLGPARAGMPQHLSPQSPLSTGMAPRGLHRATAGG
jgi:hypothetical protein